jgi:hypothetical protein
MASSNMRHSLIAGIITAGTLLVSVVPTVQAQAVDGAGSSKAMLASTVESADQGASARRSALASACTVTGFSPNTVVVGSTVVKAKFSVQVNGCTLGSWVVINYAFGHPNDPNNIDGVATAGAPTALLDPHYLTNATVGENTAKTLVGAWAEGEDTETVTPANADLPLTVLRRSAFSSTFDVTPEPVKKGANITVKGTLQRINLDQATKLGYIGYPKAPVDIQFAASGSSTFTTVKTVKAATGGKISTTVKATKSGTYRLSFAGNGVTSPATSVNDAIVVN